MTINFRFLLLLLLLNLAGCGGGDAQPSIQKKMSGVARAQASVEVFSGLRSNYAITPERDGFLVTDLSGTEAPRKVAKTSRLRFANFTIVLDQDSVAAQIYRVYQAAFRRRPDFAGLSFWIQRNDNGLGVIDIAKEFVGSGEFKRRYGQTPHPEMLIDSFYLNVLDRYGDAAGKQFWVAKLGTVDTEQVANVLFGFSDSAENKARVAADTVDGIGFLEADVTYPQPLGAIPSSLHIAGDIGVQTLAGESLHLNQVNSVFGLYGHSNWIDLRVASQYDINLELNSGSAAPLQKGRYERGAGVVISSLSCVASGTFTINRIDYLNAEIVFLDASFAVPCGIEGAMQRGTVTWNKFDATKAQPPASIPADFWQPPSAALPASGSYFYMQAKPDHYMLRESPVLLTPANAGLTVSNQNELLTVGTWAGAVDWRLEFQAMSALGQLVPGYYPGLRRYPFHNPAKGGFSLSRSGNGGGKSCDALNDGVVIDAVNYVNGHLRSIDLRFAMSCGVEGKLHWVNEEVNANDGLWQPAVGKTPDTGSYVYLQGEQYEYIMQGEQSLSTRANSVLNVSMENGRIVIKADGDQKWNGYFEGFNNSKVLQAGYYAVPQNAVFGWGGEGRGCGASGWFIVDSVAYDGNTVKSLDMRFELRCDPHAEAMQGKIHWVADEPFTPRGPAPIPAGLWTPTVALPASGTYIYIEGAPGNYVSGGKNYLVTSDTSTPYVTQIPGLFSLYMSAKDIFATSSWVVEVKTMDAFKRFQKGYYGNLRSATSYNPVYGGVAVDGAGAGCNRGTGWFVVDDVAYNGDQLAMIELRVEYRCTEFWGDDLNPLHGKIRWTRSP